MKCPNCGTIIPEGSLYCEHCGEDIHIVPDFEPEIEFNMEQTLHGIVKEINGDKWKAQEQQPEEDEMTETPRRRRAGLVAGISALCVCVLLVTVAGTMTYQYNSLEYQTKRAVQCTASKQYDRAIEYYNRVLELDDEDIEMRFALAEVYFAKNNKIEYEYQLREIVQDENATTEQLERAYGKLIAIYRTRKDYKTINELLLQSGNASIQAAYQNYIAAVPEFSIKEGYYNEVQPLKITAFGSGKIYYTLDGSEPNEKSRQYTAPLVLEDGDYVITAYFVNDNGVASESVTKEYHIEIDEIPAPELSVVSGEYHYPIPIEVLSDDEDVFYTTDGTVPTYSSTPYAGPIPLPLGKSTFCFAKIEKGIVGSVAKGDYQLTLNTEFTPEQAVETVVSYAIEEGRIFDASGWTGLDGTKYHYQYQYVTNIEGKDDFYVVSEVLEDADGVLTKTGTHFAVNAYTGELFKLQIDSDYGLTLIDIEKESRE